MTKLTTINQAVTLLTSNGFNVVVDTCEESGVQSVEIIVEGQYSKTLFGTENTDHGFAAMDQWFTTSEKVLGHANRFKSERLAILAAPKSDSNSIESEF